MAACYCRLSGSKQQIKSKSNMDTNLEQLEAEASQLLAHAELLRRQHQQACDKWCALNRRLEALKLQAHIEAEVQKRLAETTKG